MALPTIFETCTPREDVLKGTIAEADFAADLAKVIRGIASDDYQKPERFFAHTYPTVGLQNLLRNVLARLTITNSGKYVSWKAGLNRKLPSPSSSVTGTFSIPRVNGCRTAP